MSDSLLQADLIIPNPRIEMNTETDENFRQVHLSVSKLIEVIPGVVDDAITAAAPNPLLSLVNLVGVNLRGCAGASIGTTVDTDFDFTTASNAHTRYEISHTKLHAESSILVVAIADWYANVAGACFLGVLLDRAGSTLDMTELTFNETSSHKLMVGFRLIAPPLAVGAHYYKMRWRTTGATTIQTDTSDFGAIFAMEVIDGSTI